MDSAIFELLEALPDVYGDVIFASGSILGVAIGMFFSLVMFLVIGIFTPTIEIFIGLVEKLKCKKSGKLTKEQRLELLEDKIDSLADIVISASPEVK